MSKHYEANEVHVGALLCTSLRGFIKALAFCLPCWFGINTVAIAQSHDSMQQIIALNQNEALAKELHERFIELGKDYQPRTEHFTDSGEPVYINRLVREDSPYLLQHAHNPVNWYPWGDEAFKVAQEEGRPIFLSIGYATCHWCHVMERESFENEAIAQIMNEHFISIKVDREQLPDVDALYMSGVMLINGSGGWPMSSFLDSQGRTFYGGTYFPPEQFSDLLKQVSGLWGTDRAGILDQAAQLSEAMHTANDLQGEARDIGESQIARATASALTRFDDLQGGFGHAPKFPQESVLYFLLDQAQRKDYPAALDAVDFTLKSMAAGGIHDRVAGGFHRYSVDNEWLVPHFEKMLYNQGSLARNYAQASVLTGDIGHARTAKRILDYVLREMRTDEGLFYSATDADSEGGEGFYFTWTPDELKAALGAEDADLARQLWSVTDEGNFEHRNILFLPADAEELAEELGMNVSKLMALEDRLNEELLEYRQQRTPPLRDDKVITSWNALMITAFAEAGNLLDEPRYATAAVQAAEALWRGAHRSHGHLWRTQYKGRPSIEARQADYAYFAEALIKLYDLDGNQLWLDRAVELTDAMLEHFWDSESGGFYMASDETVTGAAGVRTKDLYDSSMPAGNSVAMRVLAQLFKRTGESQYGEYADRLISFFSSSLAERPGGHYYLLTGVAEHLTGESGTLHYAGRGVVKAMAQRTDDGKLKIDIAMADGWHINSDKPLQDYLIPTSLTTVNDEPLPDTNYPQAMERKLGFQSSTLSLYEGDISIVSHLPGEDANSRIKLRLQACSDEICLAPEILTFTLPKDIRS